MCVPSGVVVPREVGILYGPSGEGKAPCVKNSVTNSDIHSERPKMINPILVFQSRQPKLYCASRVIVCPLLKLINEADK